MCRLLLSLSLFWSPHQSYLRRRLCLGLYSVSVYYLTELCPRLRNFVRTATLGKTKTSTIFFLIFGYSNFKKIVVRSKKLSFSFTKMKGFLHVKIPRTQYFFNNSTDLYRNGPNYE